MNRPLIIIAGAEGDELSAIVGAIREALDRALDPEAPTPRITSTTGDPDKIVLPSGWHTTY